MNDELFDYSNLGESWVYFTKCARGYFARLIQQKKSEDPDISSKVKVLKYVDYAARLMYVLSFFADQEFGPETAPSEFDLDWAMLMAKPASVSTAKLTVMQLMDIGFIEKVEEVDDNPPGEHGGNTSPNTEFDFD